MPRLRLPIAVFALVIAATSAFAQMSSASAWPMKEWTRKTLKEAGIRETEFTRFMNYAYMAPGSFTTDSIVVIKDGYLVYESHSNGYKGNQKHALWSMTKTFQNALVGILERKGRLHRDDSAQKYYPKISNKDLTVTHLLRMSSGLDWVEENKESFFKSDPLKYYFRKAFADMADFTALVPFAHTPNSYFSYSTADATLTAATLRGAIGEKDYLEFPWRELFEKIGMQNVAIERDPSGLLGTMGLGYASPYDLAKFGLLYLRNGVVNGEQLWPNDWVQFTSAIAPAQNNPHDPNDLNVQNDQSYGAHMWLNKKRPQDKRLPYPDLPEDVLLGLGMRGQFLLIFPSENVILVRTASDTEFFASARQYYRKELFRMFYASFKKETKR